MQDEAAVKDEPLALEPARTDKLPEGEAGVDSKLAELGTGWRYSDETVAVAAGCSRDEGKRLEEPTTDEAADPAVGPEVDSGDTAVGLAGGAEVANHEQLAAISTDGLKALASFRSTATSSESERETCTQKDAEQTCLVRNNSDALVDINIDINQAWPDEVSSYAKGCKCRKRLRADLGCVGPVLKKTVHDANNEANRITQRYLQVASSTHDMIVGTGLSITEASAAKSLSDLKLVSSMANTELYTFLKGGYILKENSTECFTSATWFMARCVFNKYEKCVGVAVKSISVLSTYLRETYVVEDEFVPVLNTLETRVQRFQNQNSNKKLMRPIQSISDGFLVDLRQINAYAGKVFVRNEQNWSRFTAVGNALSEWLSQALRSNMPRSGLFNNLLDELLKFDVKYPDRLPYSLIRYVYVRICFNFANLISSSCSSKCKALSRRAMFPNIPT
ncbi:unnamed protein product [Phytophthora fragariaefolia]|uniref:Unnamed protein product n=1 Tax=Phytophthora fragariaefolia TaxID=1490495 RepID=A0A9W7CW29_9STRA|nr:unnamed protein product [Phytophthora fragariaefolia]